MKKRILSILLTLVMLISLLPTMALADDPHTHDGITFEPWGDNAGETTSLPTEAGNWYLTKDVTLSGNEWNVPAGTSAETKTTNLDLNGHVIKQTTTKKGVIIVPQYAALNLYDCNSESKAYKFTVDPSTGLWTYAGAWNSGSDTETATIKKVAGGVITGGTGTFIDSEWFDYYEGGGVYVADGSSFTMNGGSIAGNTADFGGGVGVEAGGSFTMNNGGSIAGNTAPTYGAGGGVYVASSGSFTMNGGSIADNTAAFDGGGVSVTDGGALTMNGGSITGNTTTDGELGNGGGVSVGQGGTFTMNGGSIADNTAACDGGGVSVNSFSPGFKMNGGSITGNTATGNGGGVIVYGNNLTLGGTSVVTGNTAGAAGSKAASNLYLYNATFTLGTSTDGSDGNKVLKPADGMSVGVTTETAPVAGSPVAITTNGTEDDVKYFFSDDSAYYVKHDAGALQLVAEDPADLYDVWVGSTQTSAHNCTDVLHDGGSVKYDNATKTLTLNGATIAAGKNDSQLTGIWSNLPEEETLTVKLIGSNVIGRASDKDLVLKKSDYDKYAVSVGLYIDKTKVPAPKKANPDGSVLFVGDKNSSLTIYDYMAGIEAGDVTFGTDFKGALNVYDYGGSDNCAISAGRWDYDAEEHYVCVEGGDVTINGGTFNLTSTKSNGIHANNVTVKNAKSFTVNAYDEAIDAYGKVTFQNCANVDLKSEDEDAVYAGDILIENSTVDVISVGEDGLDADTDENGVGSVIIKNSKVTIHAEDNGIECNSLTVEGAETEVYSVGGTDNNGGYGLRVDGDANALTIKGGSVKLTGAEAAIRASDEAFTVSLPSGAALKGNANKDTFTNLQDITMKTVEKYKYSYVGEQVAKSAAVITATPSYSSSGSTPTVTVPVNGNSNSVKVSASVSGSTATVKQIKDADLAKVVDAEAVEIDLSGLNKNIDTAKIPTTTVEKIGEQTGMSVKLSTATVTFDQTATQEISDQAKGNTVELVVDDVKEVSLNAVQKEAVGKLDTALIIDAHLVSNGTRLCSESKGGFGGGKATVVLPYEIKNNRTPANYSVYYVDDAGKLQKLNAVYDKELAAFVFEIEHFSVYAVAYDENAVCPKDATCPISKFTDTKVDFWWHDGIHYCVENGMMNGVADTQFAPNGTITRGMIVTMLWRLDGQKYPNYYMTFKDVPASEWYTEAVRWAAAEKIVSGYDAEHFGPNDPVTREQLATILYNYAKYKGQGFTGSWMFLLDFVDRASISDWADEAVHWCSMKGIVGGKDGKVFDPQGKATRAEAATMLQRFCEALEK